mgnify:CR=1 FL=1
MSIRDIVIGGLTGTALTLGGITALDEAPSVPTVCPVGWADTSSQDGHLVVSSCFKDGWLVILDPDHSFSYAWQDGSPAFEFDSSKVAGWSK